MEEFVLGFIVVYVYVYYAYPYGYGYIYTDILELDLFAL